MAPPFFWILNRSLGNLPHAFHRGEGAVSFRVGIEDEYFEFPIFAGVDGLNVGGNGDVWDDLVGGIEQDEIDLHGEVTVLGNIFDCAGNVLGTVVFVGGEAMILEEEIGIFGLGGGISSRLRGGSGFDRSKFFSQTEFHQHGVAGAFPQAKGFAGGGPLQNKHKQFARNEDAGHETEDGGAVPSADGGSAVAALDADSFVFIENDSAVHACIGVIRLSGGDGFNGFGFGLRVFWRGAATGRGHCAAASAAAFHGGRGGGSLGGDGLGGDGLCSGEFGLVQLGALPTMRACHDGALKIGRVFQMLATGLAGAFVHAGGTHSLGH